MSDLVTLLDLADLAIARASGILDEGTRADVATTANRLRSRTGYVEDYLVVALAGGTGSGKSSILNALLSEPVVTVGEVRPTTSAATAVTPSGTESVLSGLMAALNIDNSVTSPSLSTTILVDLPDFDSIEVAHRHIVERVLPTVDAVLWVLDPEKYADPVVHDVFLSKLSPYEDQFIFVLNQVDRLGDDAPLVMKDLQRLLVEDGYRSPEVVRAVASGDINVADLEEAVARRFGVKTTAIAKAAVDLQVAASNAWRSCRQARDNEQEDFDHYPAALAEATFVSLGVEACDFRVSTTEGVHV